MKIHLSEEAVADSVTNRIVRTHPEWANSSDYPADRYYDFKADPSLIARVLDGFKGWKDWSAWEGVQSFYRLLEWMNGPGSRFESSGCGFNGPHPDTEGKRWPGKLLTTGGLIFLFRDLALNLSDESASWAARPAPQGAPPPTLAPGKHVGWLVERSRDSLAELSAGFEGACVNITLFTTFYAQLPRAREESYGHQVVYQWWAWGATTEETMDNFSRLMTTMFECLKRVSAEAGSRGVR